MLIIYEVTYWDEIDHHLRTEKGLTMSSTTLGEGVDRIVEFYGNDNIRFINVYQLHVDCLREEELKNFLEIDT